jgi:hypothetical protein
MSSSLTFLNTLTAAQLRLWKYVQRALPLAAAAASNSFQRQPNPDPHPAAASMRHLVSIIFTLPSLLQQLGGSVRAAIASPATFMQIMQTARELHGNGNRSVSSSRSGAAAGLGGRSEGGGQGGSTAHLVFLLGNVTDVAAGKRAQQGRGEGKAAVEFLPPSQLLKQPQIAQEYCLTVESILGGMGPAVQQQHLAVLKAAPPDVLWPLMQGSFAAQLLEQLPLSHFTDLFRSLLTFLDGDGPRASGGGSLGGDVGGLASGGGSMRAPSMHSARVLTALAFGTDVLPRLWRQVCIGRIGWWSLPVACALVCSFLPRCSPSESLTPPQLPPTRSGSSLWMLASH